MPLEEMTRSRPLSTARSRRRSATTGALLVRWSGTEPKLRIMVEGEDRARIATYAKELAAAAQQDTGAKLNGVAVTKKVRSPESPKKPPRTASL